MADGADVNALEREPIAIDEDPSESLAEVRDGILAQVREYEAARRRDPTLDRKNPVPVAEPETVVRVPLADADGSGQVPIERIVALLVAARQEHLVRFYGYDLAAELRRQQATWLTTEVTCRALRSVRGLESVRVRTRLIAVAPDRVRVEALLLDGAGTTLKAIAWLDQVWTDLASGQPAAHPGLLSALLRQIHTGEIETGGGLSARAEVVARSLRRRP